VAREFVTADFKFTLELFPRYPAEYRLTEQDQGAIVDDTHTEVQIGREMAIPGCGDSGCNSYYNVCTDLPPGAQPIKAVDLSTVLVAGVHLKRPGSRPLAFVRDTINTLTMLRAL